MVFQKLEWVRNSSTFMQKMKENILEYSQLFSVKHFIDLEEKKKVIIYLFFYVCFSSSVTFVLFGMF